MRLRYARCIQDEKSSGLKSISQLQIGSSLHVHKSISDIRPREWHQSMKCRIKPLNLLDTAVTFFSSRVPQFFSFTLLCTPIQVGQIYGKHNKLPLLRLRVRRAFRTSHEVIPYTPIFFPSTGFSNVDLK